MMERLDTPKAVLEECDKLADSLNAMIVQTIGMDTDQAKQLEAHLEDVKLTFGMIGQRDWKPEQLGLLLSNILLRSLALLSMFSKTDFDEILSNSLLSVGRQGWKQNEVADAQNNPG